MTVGANDTKQLPEDGDVYGFRWALVVKDPRLPRAEPTFEELCAAAPEPSDGEKQIGFVIDPGTDTDSPDGGSAPPAYGQCATVDESFTVQQALQSVSDIRTGNGGLICGIDGFPETGCGDVIQNPTEGPPDQPVELVLPQADEAAATTDPATTDSVDTSGSDDSTSETAEAESDDGPPWGIVVAAIVVVALAVGAYALRRRQS
jgi:hypothetical protein